MPFTTRYIDWKNFELKDLRIELKRLQSEPEDTLIEMQGADPVAILETVDQDEDKTKSVRGRALSIIFNSDVSDPFNPDTAEVFAEDDVDWQGRIIMDDGSIPFIGNLIKDDITEAFQPRPNPVQLICGDGFGALKQIELTESDGDIPRGHYRIIDYIYLCLRHINYDELPMFVAFNLYELDTDPVTSHAFIDTYLEALTFETDVNKRDDCYTVLEKILDALGCFITFDNSAYYIIRWDEWDDSTGSVTTLRFAEFAFDGLSTFGGYSLVDVDRNIASDQSPDYEGHYLSFDSAQRRFQHKYSTIRHIYKFEQPKEVPCNSAFLRGELSVTQPVDPLKKNYDYECWTMNRGLPPIANDGTSYIRVEYDSINVESDRFVLFEVQPSSTGDYYIESQDIPVQQFDRLKISCDIKHDGQVETAATGFSYLVMIVKLYGDDNTFYRLDGGTLVRDGGHWDEFDSDFNVGPNGNIERIFNGEDDDTIYSNVTLQNVQYSQPMPKSGKIRILLCQTKKSDEFETHISNLKVTLIPLIDGAYETVVGQQTQVGYTGNRVIEKQFYIGESPHPIYKGALKKFDGNYVLTESWQNFNDIFVLSDIGGTLSRFIGYQWYNTYRLTRTVIESNVQGLTDSIPSLINRWFIKHGDQDNKYFMLTSIREMNFGNCGWVGVFVETSYSAGDRLYSGATDPTFLSFKFIR